MDSMLRKHLLSGYASINKIEIITKTSLDKVSMEAFDSDEFISSAVGPTGITENVETSDPDEFSMMGPTLETRCVETSDPDEMKMGQTKNTYTIEASDEDEFLLM